VKRVLIVEDDADLRRMFRTALQFAGYDVSEAGDGLEALRAFDRDGFDLLVLDLGLPVMSGQTVLQEIAAQAHTRDVPVVVVTGTPGPHDLPAASCVLTKPVSAERLVGIVRRCIASGSSANGA
jgi:two-component system chemotaxis response regulator CheY